MCLLDSEIYYFGGVKNFAALKKYFLQYKWYYISGIVFVSLSSVFANYQAIVVRNATNDIVLAIKKSSLNHSFFLRYVIHLLVLSGISGIFMFLMRRTIIVASRHIEYMQKNELYQHFQRMDKQFLKMQSIGDLMNKISEDVSHVRMFTGPAIMYLVNVVVTLISVLSFMLHVNLLLTIVVLLPLPLFSMAIFRISQQIHVRSTRVQEKLSQITSFVQESVSSIRLIKIHTKESYFQNKLQSINEEYTQEFIKLGKGEALFQPIMTLMVGWGIITTVCLGSIWWQHGKIEPGNITEFVMYVYRLTWPFTALGWVSALIQRASASQKRINDLLHIQPQIISDDTQKQYTIKGKITFRDVSFVYKESNIRALHQINFEVKPSEVLGIAGKVGAGKSTIFQLIVRFYDADSGHILIDDVPIQQHPVSVLRKHIAYAPQDAFLFNDTVLNNIIFPNTKGDIDRVIEICKKVDIHETILNWPQQYQTMIGERGINVSGGQRQRIALARALIQEAPILLIDDVFSALDNETEQKIVQNIKSDLKNKTVLIIAQKLSILHLLADKIIYIKDGQIVESGTVEELLRMNGAYKKLYDIQMMKEFS